MKYKDTFTKKELGLMLSIIDRTVNDTNDTISFESIVKKIKLHNDYVKAYNYYADAWDGIADEDKNIIHEKMQRLNI